MAWYEYIGFLYPVFGAGLVLLVIAIALIVARDRFKK